MDNKSFNALMPFITSDLVKTIINKDKIDKSVALNRLFNSKLYSYLEDENMKVWHYSTPMLYSLLIQEETTGKIDFPDV